MDSISNYETDIVILILDYLEPDESLENIPELFFGDGAFYRIRDYVYFRLLSEGLTLHNPIFLTKITKEIPSEFRDMIDTFKSEYYFIAGGFPTKLYNELDMEYKNGDMSDIDIFILGSNDYKSCYVLDDFSEKLKFLDKKYEVKDIKTYKKEPSCIYTFSFKHFKYPIQFIFTTKTCPMEILSLFDNSHNRCGIYRGIFYVTPDAIISKETHITYFYKNIKTRRLQKALKFGMHIYGLTSEKERLILETDDLVSQSKFYKLDMSVFPIIDNPERYIYFSSSWSNSYSDCDSLLSENINLNDYENIKDTLRMDWEGNHANIYVKERTNIPYLFSSKKAILYYYVEGIVCGDLRQKPGGDIYIEDMNCLVGIKRALLDISRRAHKLEQIPKYVMEESQEIAGPNNSYAINMNRVLPMISGTMIPRVTGFCYRDGIKPYPSYPGINNNGPLVNNDSLADNKPFCFIDSRSVRPRGKKLLMKIMCCLSKRTTPSTREGHRYYGTWGLWRHREIFDSTRIIILESSTALLQ
jgi:hypothetical protein